MGLLTFAREAGEKLFGHHNAQAATAASAPNAAASAQTTAAPSATAAQSTSAPSANIDALNQTAAQAIQKYIASLGLPADALKVAYDGKSETVTLSGQVPDQAAREKVVLAAGNVANVAGVHDQLTVEQADAPAAQYYTVTKGDTLSKIAKQFYGDAGKYMRIFEANKPMLSDPDKIYPGQTLRIAPA